MKDVHRGNSKFLSYVLRHKPEEIGLTLDENGWADVAELIGRSGRHGVQLTAEQLKIIVESSDKKRFALSEDKSRIRANQGHSVVVDLQLQEIVPPDVLYHGTAAQNIEAIKTQGLLKGQRHHVHLSADTATAKNVGSRYGKPVVITIDAKQMHNDNYKFFRSENGVWLTDCVPAKYLSVSEAKQ
jgi:putative RNA 2'-phosphotransferase